MTIVDFSSLTPRSLVANYVVSLRGQGTLLPYEDYEVVDVWLAMTDVDSLLLILADVLPDYFAPKAGVTRKNPRSLRGVNKKVAKRIQIGLALRAENAFESPTADPV